MPASPTYFQLLVSPRSNVPRRGRPGHSPLAGSDLDLSSDRDWITRRRVATRTVHL